MPWTKKRLEEVARTRLDGGRASPPSCVMGCGGLAPGRKSFCQINLRTENERVRHF
jgi:hypothetical protein